MHSGAKAAVTAASTAAAPPSSLLWRKSNGSGRSLKNQLLLLFMFEMNANLAKLSAKWLWAVTWYVCAFAAALSET
jgi:hypothetical protein